MDALASPQSRTREGNSGPVAHSVSDTNLHALVIVATKGRKREVSQLIRCLEDQTLSPHLVVVVGTTFNDLPDVESVWAIDNVQSVVSPRLGASAQRNVGLEILASKGLLTHPSEFIVFFDDDFVPSKNWLETASLAFQENPRWSGLTGCVLADGVNGREIDILTAERFIDDGVPPQAHWSNVKNTKHVESLYGCNMAVTVKVAESCRFDEDLPLYSWQEDCDYSGQARRIGATVIFPACRGVHLGVKSGRVSGVRMGYSQIANPIRIASRRNMTVIRAFRFVVKAVAANLIRCRSERYQIDYRGRLKGNALAFLDMIMCRLTPTKILSL